MYRKHGKMHLVEISHDRLGYIRILSLRLWPYATSKQVGYRLETTLGSNEEFIPGHAHIRRIKYDALTRVGAGEWAALAIKKTIERLFN